MLLGGRKHQDRIYELGSDLIWPRDSRERQNSWKGMDEGKGVIEKEREPV